MSQRGEGYLGKVVLNSESTARDHLANERTFLSWTRTSVISVISGHLVGNPTPTLHIYMLKWDSLCFGIHGRVHLTTVRGLVGFVHRLWARGG